MKFLALIEVPDESREITEITPLTRGQALAIIESTPLDTVKGSARLHFPGLSWEKLKEEGDD